MKKLSTIIFPLLLLMSCSQNKNYLNTLFEDWILVEESISEQNDFQRNPAYLKFVSDFNEMCESSDFENFRSIYFDPQENFFIEYTSDVKKGIETQDYEIIRKAVIRFELVAKNQNSQASRYYLDIIIMFAIALFLVLSFLFYILQKYDRELDNTEQMDFYTAFIMNNVDKERRRISKDIHDTVLQDIRLIELETESLRTDLTEAAMEKSKSVIIDSARKSIADLRRICQNLTPSELKNITDENSLITAIHNLCEKFQEQYKITCDFSIQKNIVIEEIGMKKSMHIFRIIQEALNNVQKHAEASYVSVVLKSNESNQLVFYITDDGKGFDLANSKRDNHFGLTNMKERAKQIGATIIIQSDLDAGTEIKLIV